MPRLIALALALSSILLFWSCGTHAPYPVSQNKILAQAGLIKISEVDRTIAIDLRYKSGSAIAKKALYRSDMPALLRPETATRLKRANALLKKQGYRIKIWDAYRPPSAQIQLWDASGHNDLFVANPYNAPSQHSCGTAVDVTLVTLAGRPVQMPTGFDSFTPQAAAAYQHPDSRIMERKRILQQAMNEAGFYALPAEWWHFTDHNFRAYPDPIPLHQIQSSF